mgnify:CR=1 FL=1
MDWRKTSLAGRSDSEADKIQLTDDWEGTLHQGLEVEGMTYAETGRMIDRSCL